MEKDKKASKLSMNDLIMQDQQENKIDEVVVNSADSTTFKFAFNDEFDSRLKEYNEKITEIPDYIQDCNPRSKVLVRFYAQPLQRTKGGIIKPNKAPVQVPTRSGVGYKYIDDPYCFNLKAIVIKCPEGIVDLKPGDVVTTTEKAIRKQVKDEVPTIANGFIHPDHGDVYDYPLDPLDPNYGLISIDSYDAEYKIGKVELKYVKQ